MSAVHEESRSNEAVDAALAVRTLALAQSTLALARATAATFGKSADVPHSEVKTLIGLLEHTIAATSVFPDLPPQRRQAGAAVAAELVALLDHLVSLSS